MATYTNPTSVSAGNPTYGTSNQFNVDQFMPPFDYGQQYEQGYDLLDRYGSAIKGQETLPAMYSRISGQLNIDPLREQTQRYYEQADDLTSALMALPQNVRDRSMNSLMTSAQAGRAVQAEGTPIQNQLTQVGALGEKAASRLASAESELTKRMGLEEAQQEQELLPFEKEFSFLERMQAAEQVGWSTTYKNELDRLLANASNGLAWDDAEKNRAAQLAQLEKQYELELRNQKELSGANYDLWSMWG